MYVLHCKVHTENMVSGQEQQCGIGSEVEVRLLSVLREGEARVCRAWCVRSGLDITDVARADEEGQ